MRSTLFSALFHCAACWHAGVAPRPAVHSPVLAVSPQRTATVRMVDMDTIISVAVLLGSAGGGVALIAFTENAGKREAENAQPCVVCKGELVVPCTLCKGTGTDPFADLVAGVKEMSGDAVNPEGGDRVVIDDWDVGEKEVVMYEEILSKFPVKATEKICIRCSGRGVVVCDNCAPAPSHGLRPECGPTVPARFPPCSQARARASSRASSSAFLRTTSWIELSIRVQPSAPAAGLNLHIRAGSRGRAQAAWERALACMARVHSGPRYTVRCFSRFAPVSLSDIGIRHPQKQSAL